MFFSMFKISLDSLFAGMLALAGFIFTARTFIVFKLNDSFYSNDNYRNMIEELRKDGAYRHKLYTPLKNLDDTLHKSTIYCLTSVIVFFFCSIFYSYFDSGLGVQQTQDCELTIMNLYNAGVIDNITSFLGKAIVSISISFFMVVIVNVISGVKKVNLNIKDIINHWEEDHENGDETSSDQP